MIFKGTKEYLDWLKTQEGDLDRCNEYNLLFRDLYSMIFEVRMEYDQNRVYEALSIRDEYVGDSGLHPDDVTMLELIRSLAMKCSEITFDSVEQLSPPQWFWRLLRHIGLERFYDSEYHDCGGSEAVRNILYKVIRRGYKRDGDGSLFPMRYTNFDHRKLDLWDQMTEYIEENGY